MNLCVGLDEALLNVFWEYPEYTKAEDMEVNLKRSIVDGLTETLLEVNHTDSLKVTYPKNLKYVLLIVNYGLNDLELKNRILEVVFNYIKSPVNTKLEIKGKPVFIWGDVMTAMEQIKS